MYTRSAIFEGRVLPGKQDEFYAAVNERLLPAWRQMLHATDVRSRFAMLLALGDYP